MRCLLVGKHDCVVINNLRDVDMKRADSGELCIVNLDNLLRYDPEAKRWNPVERISAAQQQVLHHAIIGPKEMSQVKALAQSSLLASSLPQAAKDDPRTYFLFEALRTFLLSKGIDPQFDMKKDE
jgi:hypothetical protein